MAIERQSEAFNFGSRETGQTELMTSRIDTHIQSKSTTYPLAPLQEGMLFHSLYAGQSGVDITQITCDWHDEVNASAFRQAWQILTQRHSVLRTSFSWQDSGSPRQQVHEDVQIPFQQKDWRDLSEHAQQERLNELLQADRQTGFELRVPPLQRVTLIRLAEEHYQVVWTFHHLIGDARTFQIVLNDLFAIYDSLQSGQKLQLNPARPYREYIDWLQTQDWSQAEDFWRKRLEGFTTPTPLPPRGSESNGSAPGGNWSEEEAVVSEDVIRALREVGETNGVTLNTFLQGAWSVVLSRYSGEEDIVFGALKACRHIPVPDAENMAGPLINTLPVRVQCSGDQVVLEWLRTLRKQWMELRAYEHTPLAKVQSWSQAPPGRPLFETILNVLDPPWDAVLQAQGGPWSKRRFRIRNQPNYPLALDIYVAAAARLKLVYNPRCFAAPAMKRMLGHVRTVLESMAYAPNQRVGDLPLLTEVERVELLERWNNTTKTYPAPDCVHRLFEAQATQSPEALAVSSGSTRVSYQQLNEQANRIACRLRKLGVQLEARVGIFMERSGENVAGLLGILKAGAAYVPLDPEHPRERLAFMIADAGIQVLLTQRKLMAKLPDTPAQIICLDEMESETAEAHASHTAAQVTLGNLAYVIYTSGSTGTPKAVEIEHQGLLNLIRWHQERYHVRPTDRATQLANLSFDASVWELWPYLTAGASVHLPDDETRLSPDKLVAWLADQKITLTFLPTPLAEAVIDAPWPKAIALRALLTGGDRLPRGPRQKLPFELVNHYGPTENSVVTTAGVVHPQADDCEAPPIGRPIANTRLYVVDVRMRPVPVGVPGELYIAGAGLARGYLNQPKLTAEKFLLNPFCDGRFNRLYRTGDLVRYREDGNVDFLGRIDQQVKLRGYRIELGEIETLLSAHTDVREAVVVARDEGERYLAAYLVTEKRSAPSAKALRDYLQQRLPEHMVPSAFVFLDALPLTPNGKVDRKALPRPELQPSEKDFVAPRNQMEEVLAGIWCELLHRERVGVRDKFFELGGHSLLATQLISRVRNAFGVELPLQSIFDAPTIRQFVERLQRVGGEQSCSSRPPAPQPNGQQGGEIELSFGQERMWFLEQLEPGLAIYNVPIGIVLRGKLDAAALEQSVNALIERHGSLRTSFGTAQGLPTAHRATAVKLQLRIVSLVDLAKEQQQAEVQRIMTSEAAQPFDLSQAPLLRTNLLQLNSQEHLLLLTTHHIVSDGWSMAILYEELREWYEGYAHGKNISLPELPLQFNDYAAWQRQWLQGAVLEQQLEFWKRQLKGPLPALDLPSDHPRPAEQSHRGSIKYFALPNSLCSDLKSLCRREDVTLFMVLLAAFQTLLHRYSGQEEIVTGTTVAGRTQSDIEGLVGLFLNTLALRTDMSGEVTFRGLLRRVRKVALDAYAHQDVPFEKVVEALGVDRDLSRSPVFQVMFVFQKAPLPSERTGDLEWNSVPIHTGTSKFDLTLSLEEEAAGLKGYLEYDSDLFEPETVLRMLGHFQTLLQAVAENPDRKLWELPLLTPPEEQQLLTEWNSTAMEFPPQARIHDLFVQQVGRTPDAVAVVFENKSFTYREVNLRANRLAHHLQSLGVQPGIIVGICVERSLEMVIALLAVLKVGAGYLPLDPVDPPERLSYILEDSRAALVLTQQPFVHLLESVKVPLVLLGQPLQSTDGNRVLASTNVTHPEDVAYLIYTSGSTGKPKGVVVPHRAVINFLTSMAREPGLAADDVLVAVTTLSFDIAVLELLLPLTVGARVVIATRDQTVDGHALDSLLQGNGAAAMQATPVTWRLLLEAGWTPRRGFKAFVGGESLPKDLADQLIHYGVELWNMYGPTETTVWSTCARICDTSSGITIGRPIANTIVRILDEQKNLCPIGIPGELYIGGHGVALGYWKRPELTARNFISDPFSPASAARLYRTGDRARWRNDGTIEHLGRLDFQIKLRGFRIELGEIEAAIAQHSAVRDVAVIVREDIPEHKRLVAYLVAENAADLADKLRVRLRATLPEYMVPTQFVILKALPRTHNGKLDRKALPPPTVGNSAPQRVAARPQTPTEEMVLGAFRTVLNRSDFGVSDNFFDLGGHSLMAARLISRLRATSGMDLPLRDLFVRPTVAGLAEAIDALQWLRKSRTHTHAAGVREEIVL
jgi:amino acid adenylation domain-containing protein